MWIENGREEPRRELDRGVEYWSELLTTAMRRLAGAEEIDALIDAGRELHSDKPGVRGFIALSLGEALHHRNRVDEGLTALSHAAAHYREALDAQPQDAFCWNDYARTLRLLGQAQTGLDQPVAVETLQHAVAAFDRCEELRPTVGAVFNNRGNALILLAGAAGAQGDTELARNAVRRAVRDTRRGLAAAAAARDREVYTLNLVRALDDAVRLLDDPGEVQAAATELRKLLSSFKPEQCADPATMMNAALLLSTMGASAVERDPRAAVAHCRKAFAFAAAAGKLLPEARGLMINTALAKASEVLLRLKRAGQSDLRRDLAETMSPAIRSACADPESHRMVLFAAAMVQEIYFTEERWPAVLAMFEAVQPADALAVLPIDLAANVVLTAAGAMQKSKRFSDAARVCSAAIEQLEAVAGSDVALARIRLMAAGVADAAGDPAGVQSNLAAAVTSIERAIVAGQDDDVTLQTAADIQIKRAARSTTAHDSLTWSRQARQYLQQARSHGDADEMDNAAMSSTLQECADALQALHASHAPTRESCTELVAVLRLLAEASQDDPEVALAQLAHALAELAIVEKELAPNGSEGPLREVGELLRTLGPVDELREKRSSVTVTHTVMLVRQDFDDEMLLPFLQASSPRVPERMRQHDRGVWALLWRSTIPSLSQHAIVVTADVIDACERVIALLHRMKAGAQRADWARLRAPALAVLASRLAHEGKPAEAMKLFNEAALQYAMLDDEVGLVNRGVMLLGAARTARQAGLFRKAKAACEAAASYNREAMRRLEASMPAETNLIAILCTLADDAIETGALEQAMQFADEAVQTARDGALRSNHATLYASWADALRTRAGILEAADRSVEGDADLRQAIEQYRAALSRWDEETGRRWMAPEEVEDLIHELELKVTGTATISL